MNNLIKISPLILILLVQVSYISAQNTDDSLSKERIVKWEALNGKNNEFIFYMPQGYETVVDGGFYIGGNSKVDKKLIVSRYINGVILLMEYYEGDAKQIQKYLQEKEKSPIGRNEEINGFDFKQFVGDDDGYFNKTQYFRNGNRLYIVKVLTKSVNNEIVKDFFESVKLINDNKVVSPNVTKDMKTITLSNISEREPSLLDDKNAIEAKTADRKPIILIFPRPRFPENELRSSNTGKVKLRVLYSSSGKIAEVEVLRSPSKALSEVAIEAAKKTKFLPAEKDGKLVSVYQTQEYSFDVR